MSVGVVGQNVVLERVAVSAGVLVWTSVVPRHGVLTPVPLLGVTKSLDVSRPNRYERVQNNAPAHDGAEELTADGIPVFKRSRGRL